MCYVTCGYVYIREMFQSNVIISACSFNHSDGGSIFYVPMS